jgi:phosphonoacetaldehyde hydrolase
MGLPKRDHIGGILTIPRVRDAWRAVHGRNPASSDVETMYEAFVPLQLACLAEYSGLIPGVLDAVQRYRARGLKIGTTTGYSRAMLDLLLERSGGAGLHPDCSVAPEDVGAGRPEPFMIYENAVRLKVYPLASIAKVGDTPADIAEGLNAGAWSIGVGATGNGIGISHDEFEALPPRERRARVARARRQLERAGAHYVVDSVAELDPVLDDIARRLSAAHARSGARSRRGGPAVK